jgi:hypothetical protein
MELSLSLYKIADALQIPIEYVDGTVAGKLDASYDKVPGLCLPVKVRVKKLYVHETVGVLVDVIGDLAILVSHVDTTGALTAILIDKNKLEMDGVKTPPELFFTKRSSGREVVDALRGSIVASFMWHQRKWSPLKLPK